MPVEAYNTKARCFVEQYGNFSVKDRMARLIMLMVSSRLVRTLLTMEDSISPLRTGRRDSTLIKVDEGMGFFVGTPVLISCWPCQRQLT